MYCYCRWHLTTFVLLLQVTFNTLEGMLSQVITRLTTSLLYEKEDSDIPAVSCFLLYSFYWQSGNKNRFSFVPCWPVNMRSTYGIKCLSCPWMHVSLSQTTEVAFISYRHILRPEWKTVTTFFCFLFYLSISCSSEMWSLKF